MSNKELIILFTFVDDFFKLFLIVLLEKNLDISVKINEARKRGWHSLK